MADRYIYNNTGTLTEREGTVTSTGAPEAGDLVALDGTGKLDPSVLPTGIGADTASVVSSENLAAGDLVNIYDNAGTPNVRKADASVPLKEAHGFVLAAVTSPAAATVYFEGSNTQVTGLTAGRRYLSATVPGGTTATAPSGAGQVVQRVGIATSATVLNFEAAQPIVLV